MGFFDRPARAETGDGLPETSAKLGRHDAERLHTLDHKRQLTPAEGRELRALEKRAQS